MFNLDVLFMVLFIDNFSLRRCGEETVVVHMIVLLSLLLAELGDS